MQSLEEYFRKNRQAFDTEEPLSGHMERFSEKLRFASPDVKSRWNMPMVFRIAATVAVLLGVSLFFMERNGIFSGQNGSPALGLLPGELSEAMAYYDRQVTAELRTIRELAATDPESRKISDAAAARLSELDANTAELSKCLELNPGDVRVMEAILRNQKAKEGIVSSIRTSMTEKQH